MREFFLRIILLAAIALCSCEKEAGSTTQAADGLTYGFDEFVLEMPILSRYEAASSYESVQVEFMGEDDLVEYTLTMATLGSDGQTLRLEADAEPLSLMPHQRYFLNRIILPEDSTRSEDSSTTEITVGAILTAEDPEQISFISTFDTRTDSVGSGSYGDPYTIVTLEDLLTFSSNMIKGSGDSYHGKYVKQTGNIDGTLNYSLDDTGYWAPIGTGAPSVSVTTTEGVAFRGCYDGSGLYISNLNSDNLSNIGLFMALGDGALIKNLQLLSLCFSGDTQVGGLASWVEDDAAVVIEDCFVSGYVNGKEDVGGFLGSGSAKFVGCTSNVSLARNNIGSEATDFAANFGGYIGRADDDCSFENCNFTGSISQLSTYDCGGFIGTGDGSYDEGVDICINLSFKHCGVTGMVGGLERVGGVIGRAYNNSIHFENVVIGGTYVHDQITGEYTKLYGGAAILLSCNCLKNLITYYYDHSIEGWCYHIYTPSGDAYAGGFFGGSYGSAITFGSGCEVSNHTYIPKLAYEDLDINDSKYQQDEYYDTYLGGIGGGLTYASYMVGLTVSFKYSTLTSYGAQVQMEASFGSDQGEANGYVSGIVSYLNNTYAEQEMITDLNVRIGESSNLSVANTQFIYSSCTSSCFKDITITNNSKYKESDVPLLSNNSSHTNITYTE